MKRREFTAELLSNDAVIARVTKYAWNSAIHGSESLVRMHARAMGEPYEGTLPRIDGHREHGRGDGIYLRDWHGLRTGQRLTARVLERAS